MAIVSTRSSMHKCVLLLGLISALLTTVSAHQQGLIGDVLGGLATVAPFNILTPEPSKTQSASPTVAPAATSQPGTTATPAANGGTSQGAVTAGGGGTTQGTVTTSGGTTSSTVATSGGTISGTVTASGGTSQGTVTASGGTSQGTVTASSGTSQGTVTASSGTTSGTVAVNGGTTSAVSGGTSTNTQAPLESIDSPAIADTLSAATATSAPAATPACDDATTTTVTQLFKVNVVLDDDCAAANGNYRFPFGSVPGRTQLYNMGKTPSCSVLMQALLQLVPTECNFGRIPLRTTAASIVQLAKNLRRKTTGDNEHILLNGDLLVIGTWSDNPDNYDRTASLPSSLSVTVNAKVEVLDSRTTPATSSAGGSLQSAVVGLQAALVLAWVFV